MSDDKPVRKELVINGITYVEKTDKSDVLADSDVVVADHHCIGVGSLHLNRDFYTITRVSLEFLEKAVRFCKSLDKNSFLVGVGQDIPLIIGDFDNHNKQIIGFVIAPRSDKDG